MKICVVGWYFYPELYETLAGSCHDVFVVAHREGNVKELRHARRENVGLEFGAYNWYLNNEWDGFSGVLFMHDDIRVDLETLEEIEKKCGSADQAFVFSSMDEAKANGMAHGRMIWCSGRFLRLLKEDGGIWYDKSNHGDILDKRDDSAHHNEGIKRFRGEMLKWSTVLDTNKVVFVPELCLGFRGQLEKHNGQSQEKSNESDPLYNGGQDGFCHH